MNWLRKKLPANPTTVTGRMVGVATATALLAVVDSSLIPLLSQLIWVVIIAFLCGLLFRPKLVCRLKDLRLLVNGEVSTLELVVENTGGYPVYDVQLSFPYADYGLLIEKHTKAIGELASRGKCVVSFQVQAIARGEHSLPTLLIATSFPFGMFKFIRKQRIEGCLTVAPSFGYDAFDESLTHTGDTSLGALNSRRQRSLEYLGSLVYREGLPFRRWDFAAWARLGVPSIREFNETLEPTALIVVDAFKRRGSVDKDLEMLLSKAASAVASLDRQGVRIIIVVVGTDIEVVDGSNSSAQLDLLLRCMAKIAGTAEQPAWPDVWHSLHEMQDPEWDLFCFLRSDHAGDSLLSTNELGTLDSAIHWTPDRRIASLSESKDRRSGV
ncbi:MAG: DUF58 domain-containing protein [Pirellulaceae bacterium]|nr:DUF58 domain-containing protein [Pirellulaceae bacterium]